jgi:cell division protein FtsZ
MEFDMVDNAALGTVIKVVGVGGAGGNAVQHMINKGVSGVEFIAANTDAQALAVSGANNIIQIGDSGLGAGMRPEVGRQLAEQSRSRIEDALRGAHMVFIAAGMGGGTGTGAAPIVAEVAKTMGALTVAVVSKPFSYEGQKCMDVAEAGLEELTKHVDSLIVILNEKLEDIYEDESMLDWMKHADDVLNNAVAGIAEIINVPGHINHHGRAGQSHDGHRDRRGRRPRAHRGRTGCRFAAAGRHRPVGRQGRAGERYRQPRPER